ncbi:MAG TPA: hypothetical protein VGO62_14520, partial [Myxococcota bacterium]
MRALIAFAALAMLFAGLVALSACPPAVQCANQSDCPIGKVCDGNSTCVDAVPPGDAGFQPFDAGTQPGEGEGEGQGGDVVQVGAAVALFQDDAALSPNALIAVSGGLDAAGTFDPAQGALSIATPLDDFTTLQNGCGLDSIFRLSAASVGANILPQGDETWFQCATHPRVIIASSGGLAIASDPAPTPASAQLAVLLAPYVHTASENEVARVVTAARGGTALQILRIEPTDAVNNARTADTVSVTFQHVQQIFPALVDDPTLGDVILVFDRGSTAKLVPLQRDPQTSVWHGAPLNGGSSNVVPLTLPTNTDAVVLRSSAADVIDFLNLSTSADQDKTPNLIAIAPRADTGSVTFLRYEQELLTANSSNFILMHLNIGAGDPAVKPGDTDRIL